MHRDDSKSSDVFASIEVDEANALAAENRYQDAVDKPFFVSRDPKYPMQVHPSRESDDDDGDEERLGMAGSFVADQ